MSQDLKDQCCNSENRCNYLKTYEMVVFTFSILDKDGKERFFEESFLLADVQPNVVLKRLFLTMSNADIDFQSRNLQ